MNNTTSFVPLRDDDLSCPIFTVRKCELRFTENVPYGAFQVWYFNFTKLAPRAATLQVQLSSYTAAVYRGRPLRVIYFALMEIHSCRTTARLFDYNLLQSGERIYKARKQHASICQSSRSRFLCRVKRTGMYNVLCL